jgi:hypothetical protein
MTTFLRYGKTLARHAQMSSILRSTIDTAWIGLSGDDGRATMDVNPAAGRTISAAPRYRLNIRWEHAMRIFPMRIFITIVSLFILAASPVLAKPASCELSPAAEDRNEAGWAEREAQARITDGDYEGAVQAQHQADVDRQQAERYELTERAAKR